MALKLKNLKPSSGGYWMEGGMKGLTPKDKMDAMGGALKQGMPMQKMTEPKKKRNLMPSPGSRYA